MKAAAHKIVVWFGWFGWAVLVAVAVVAALEDAPPATPEAVQGPPIDAPRYPIGGRLAPMQAGPPVDWTLRFPEDRPTSAPQALAAVAPLPPTRDVAYAEEDPPTPRRHYRHIRVHHRRHRR
jgi:hypothetical protein